MCRKKTQDRGKKTEPSRKPSIPPTASDASNPINISSGEKNGERKEIRVSHLSEEAKQKGHSNGPEDSTDLNVNEGGMGLAEDDLTLGVASPSPGSATGDTSLSEWSQRSWVSLPPSRIQGVPGSGKDPPAYISSSLPLCSPSLSQLWPPQTSPSSLSFFKALPWPKITHLPLPSSQLSLLFSRNLSQF